MARCWSCSRVKGKRICPARGGDLICSRCCGTKRRVEIRCPADCPYLHGTHDSRWTPLSQEKGAARFFGRALALDEKTAQFYLFLHYLIGTRASVLQALSDGELRDVVDTAVRTLETQAKGVLYSHTAASPRLQPMAEWLVRLVSMREKIQGAPPVSDAEALAALRTLSTAVSEHESAAPRERYLASVMRVLSDSLSEVPALELPEGLDEPPRSLIVTP